MSLNLFVNSIYSVSSTCKLAALNLSKLTPDHSDSHIPPTCRPSVFKINWWRRQWWAIVNCRLGSGARLEGAVNHQNQSWRLPPMITWWWWWDGDQKRERRRRRVVWLPLQFALYSYSRRRRVMIDENKQPGYLPQHHRCEVIIQ